ncbi:MAG TPA: hypothetical protein VNF74_16075, partial [Terriglobales bacterium]|nr:hypothetical protein [Terriglobales bacterium]
MTPAAVLNHLWQSTVFAGVAAAVALLLRGNQARVRFWIWMAASLKFLVPFSALAALGALLPWPRERTVAPALAAASAPFHAAAATMVFYSTTGGEPSTSLPQDLLPWLLAAIGLAGSLALLLRWGRSWPEVRGAPRRSRAAPVRLPPCAARLAATRPATPARPSPPATASPLRRLG